MPEPPQDGRVGAKTAQGSDGGRTPTPVHGLIVPVLLAVSDSSGHVGAPHNCLQSLHKAFAELALQRGNTLPEWLRGPWGPLGQVLERGRGCQRSGLPESHGYHPEDQRS